MATAPAPAPSPLTPADYRTDRGQSAHRRRGWLARLPAAAGAGYLVAWIAGLAAWPSNLALNASSVQVAASHRAHAAPAITQYLLVEGVAGLLLGVVLAAAWIPAAGRRPSWPARGAIVLGAGAVLISLTQSVLGLILTAAATNHENARAGDLFDVLNRLDGVKMLALAGVAAWLVVGLGAGRHPRRLPRWLQAATVLAAVALVVSGLGYLLLANGLAWTVYLSGPLLLLWITGTGIWLTARVRTSQARNSLDH